MNLFNKAIYKNHLEHTAEGTKWGKHKYLYITETGRYVYPEDIAKGRSADQFRQQQINDQKKSAHQGVVARGKANIARSRQINDQIRSAHVNATSSKMELTPGSELKKRADARAGAKTSGVAAGSKSVSSNPATRNTITIKKTETAASKPTTTATAKTEEKNTETTTTNTGEKYKNMSEETKQWLMKNAGKDEKKEGTKSGKKGGSGKKKGSGSKSSKATKTEEQKQMGLSDDDLKKMEVNTQATDREEVLKNIALRVIRGDYGNGADRKAKLGNYYDEVQQRVNELMKSGNIQREGQSQQQTQQAQTEKKTTNTSNTSSSSTSNSSKEYKREDYKKGDKDFDDKNYSDKNRLGNTDFFSYKRDDGKYVILEEDMKWVVDEKPSTKMIKNLEAMDEYIDARKKNGTWEAKNASKEWDQLASIAINGGDLTEKAAAEKKKVKNSVKHSDLKEGMFLAHFGTKRHSGRFPFGSGARPYQHGGGPRKNSTFRQRRAMSDEELSSAINRARNEATLYREERNNRSEGQKFVEDVLTRIGKDVLTNMGKGALLWAGKEFATKVLDKPELGEFMSRGGPEKKKK